MKLYSLVYKSPQDLNGFRDALTLDWSHLLVHLYVSLEN